MAKADKGTRASPVRRALGGLGLGLADLPGGAAPGLSGGSGPAEEVPEAGDLAARSWGRLQLRFLVIFAAVYGLSDADITTVGTAATELRHSLLLSNFQLGSLVSVTTAVGALTTLPAGALADRARRVPVLAWSVALWALAMGASSLATSYAMLVSTRVLLGGVLAVNGPITASLLGDLWPAGDRGRIYGLITGGELLGAGAGFVVSGELAAFSWRLAFGVLSLPAIVLAWLIWRLPEPQRHFRRERLAPGLAVSLPIDGSPSVPTVPLAALGPPGPPVPPGGDGPLAGVGPVAPRYPWTFWRVLGYVLTVRTNVVLVLAGGLAWMFLSGLESFGEEFVKEQYGLGQGLATLVLLIVGLGAIAGALVSGNVGDSLVHRGHRAARMSVAASATVLSTVALLPALVTRDVMLALVPLIVAAFGVGAADPPIDASRMEVVPSWIWGRAEGVRSVLRMGFQAVAPLLVGFLADSLAGGGRHGLQLAFLSMLALLLAAGFLLLAGHRTYPADRESALAAERYAAFALDRSSEPGRSSGLASPQC